MASIVVVSGCSGVGKSTVSRHLVGLLDSSVHIPADTFYLWFDDPWPDAATAEGARRYDSVGAAVGAAANRLAMGGYTVILDCPMFPDGVDALSQICARQGVQVHYAVLRAELPLCLARMKHRDGGVSWDLAELDAFHARFHHLTGVDANLIDASKEAESVAHNVLSAFRSGQLLRQPGPNSFAEGD